ncbi:tyrosyl-DNA phosphodiesterase 1 [Talaromyces islandicus]|uniref:Tyrosyl-DNA phosphodiesterase 1 n=1 Tax=Talaromyces islandicus TaxID=28573 RepID=A0A0U1LUP3_TALIS|nr:tyrosyl-DNA phosphodiesterase 1 [Talaromyces islandicus]
MDRPAKRQRVTEVSREDVVGVSSAEHTSLTSLHRAVTPPSRFRPRQLSPSTTCTSDIETALVSEISENKEPGVPKKERRILRSPFQLSHVRGFPPSSGNNVDTIRLRDILGDPLIRECWQFNYCFDVDFVMSQFDEDVRDIVKVKIVHGSWKKDSPNRIAIDEACARYPNAEAITAYMPEPFGTHHSKMMVLLRHDDLAQVIIHTANMIPGDWANMSQAVWRSSLLPLLRPTPAATSSTMQERFPLGSGEKFKRDLLAYLEFYGSKKTGSLVMHLKKHDFSSVRAALIASVPSREKICTTDSKKSTLWGWPALRDTLRQIPLKSTSTDVEPHIVVQVSSIATLGQTDKWLKGVLFSSLTPPSKLHPAKRPVWSSKYSIIFPTADEIRRSLNGYGSGGSIHMKLQSAAQQRQLQYLRPFLCRWAGDQDDDTTLGIEKCIVPERKEAGRRRAAPHIKTYIQFSDKNKMDRIDWAMITSANLSTQAWGALANKNDEVRICSWEIGVLVWPGLIADDDEAEMVPCFKRDAPDRASTSQKGFPTVGLRMPYDLPLTPYNTHDVPWCAMANHLEPDWLGQTWEI